ncbi:lytic murein transglycosylase [Nocardioides sp. TRM66260-LWL]|uniref:lytic transglycosylase domain-containing protein n=1 Tax=Nocardioides sp. TRM66260-LWL TaxID=2874478 RepID=UPI001CC7B6C9|nr:lytic murein transglycosylase [Nocardioides sp. TRM66260-LWL]MBZ5734798.1 lytic murein transglycosylase [Nocardioides sp. TRM66260-LWL]
MPIRRIATRRAATLVPLALLSTAWTASLATSGGGVVVAAPAAPAADVEAPATVPSQAIEAPASVSAPDEIAPGVAGVRQAGGVGGADFSEVVARSTTAGIPAVALAAYQRAESVINAADPSCNLTWQLVAAIGRVESNHGRFGGNVLNDQGVATPGIYGPALDGRKGTTKVTDTDAGALDRDRVYDHAVGPMQFIPSTWSVVGVDADDDGQRNPQDIDDAALATAVYLCSGSDDLSTTAGQEAAVFRYNHSKSYVDLVLRIMDAYASGDYTAVPNTVSAAGYLAPVRSTPSASPSRGGTPTKVRPSGSGGTTGGGAQAGSPTEPDPSSSPSPSPSASPSPGTGGGSGSGDGPKGGLGVPGLPTPTIPALPSTGVKPVDGLLSLTQALLQCTLDGYVNNLLDGNDPYDQCVKRYTTKG